MPDPGIGITFRRRRAKGRVKSNDGDPFGDPNRTKEAFA
jgi:hypothetical protein